MKSFEIKLKNRLNNKNSSYYKRFNGILTKIVTCKNINEVKEIYKNDLVEYKELKKLEKLINKIQKEEDSYIKEFCNENNIKEI